MDRLRFKDINGNNFQGWKEYRLDNVAKVYQPQTISTNMFSIDGFPVYGANGIIGFYNKYNHEYDQVLVSCRGENCGKVNLSNGKAWITGNTMVINVDGNEDVDKIFLFFQLSNQNLRYLISGSGQPQIVGNAINKHSILLPKREEQEKIGGFLSSFDKLIQKQQDKIGSLKELKKGYLQQMFAEKGSNAPKIRFKGFTDDWEQRKFDDLCSIITKQTGFDYTATIKKSLLTEETEKTLPYLQTKNFSGTNINYNTDYFIPKTVASDFPKINLDEKCILFSIVGASVGNIGFFPGDKHCFLSGAICVSKLKEQDDAEFIYHFMCSSQGQEQIQTCTKGGAQATVTIEDIRKFDVLLPSKKERIKIGEALSYFDKLISLHKRKLEELEETKKGYMQRLFA